MWRVQEIFRFFRPNIATKGKYRDKFDEPLPNLSRHTAKKVFRFALFSKMKRKLRKHLAMSMKCSTFAPDKSFQTISQIN